MISGIYRIRNTKKDVFYIGSTKDFLRRKRDHWRELRKGTHSNPKLQRSWDLYGEENFRFEIVQFCDVPELLRREQEHLDRGDCYYNLSMTAGCVDHTPQVRAKMSRAGKERFRVHNGKSIKDLVEEAGVVSYGVAIRRMQRGWTLERAVSEPPDSKHRRDGLKKYSFYGVMRTLSELAQIAETHKGTLYRALQKYPPEVAVERAIRNKKA